MDRQIRKYPETERVENIIDWQKYNQQFLDTPGEYDYDNKKSFMDNIMTFYKQVPKPNLLYFGRVNEQVSYSDAAFGAKSSYLSFVIGDNVEYCLYTCMCYTNCDHIYNSFSIMNACAQIYQSVFVTRSYQVYYSKHIHNCSDIRFSTGLQGCKECLFCHGLENVSYAIHNEVLEKDIYYKKKTALLGQKNMFASRYTDGENSHLQFASKDCTGGAMAFCHDMEEGHYISRINHGRNAICGEGMDNTNHMYDVLDFGLNSSHFYGVLGAGMNSEHLYCTSQVDTGVHIYYCYFLTHCSYCLGCIGLQNKQFYIFNKQYSKEERYQKVDEIFGMMEKEGTLGDFFPGSMNPFYFNDTAAYLIDDSFTKEEVEAEGYLWRDEVVKVDIPKGVEVVSVDELGKYEGWKEAKSGKLQAASKKGELDAGSLELRAGAKRRIDPEILKKVIRDKEGNVYRIVKMEYDFLMKHGLPLPRLHRLDRLKQNFKIH